MAKKSKHPRVPASPRESEKLHANPALVPKLRFPEFRSAGHWTTEPAYFPVETIVQQPVLPPLP
jgi:hypothetical protein